MIKILLPSRNWLLVFGLLFMLVASKASVAANGCSVYSSYGGNNGKTWFNEYYFGNATNNYLEIFSKNSAVNQSNPAIWNNWRVGVYTSKGTTYYGLNSSTTACTVSGGRTFLTYSTPSLNLNNNDAMVVVFDGDPSLSSTKEIDAFVYSNASPPAPYNNTTKFYTPTCPALKSALDSQVTAIGTQSTYSGKNILILSSFGNKDASRIPDGTGNWSLTSSTGSGTSYTECVTNDPVDLVKSFVWTPYYAVPVSSGTVDPGALVTFIITARNATIASMNGVKVSDTLPAGLTLTGTPTASAGASVSCSGAPTTCILTAPATLAPNATVSMSFNAIVSNNPSFAGATIQNSAEQSAGTTYDPPPTADAFITVGSGLTLAIAADKSIANAGEQVTFTVTAQNASAYPMSGAIVTIPLPGGLTYYSGYTPVISSGGGAVSCSLNSCTWTLPATLAAGATPTLTFQATAAGSSGQTMTVTATQTAGATLTTNPYASVNLTMATTSAGSFNACHNFASSSCSALNGRLFTRLAATTFTTDIAALKADGTLNTGYVGSGGAAKTVKVDLIDVSNANTVVATQNVSFPANDTTGRITVSWPAPSISNAYSHLKVRVSETSGAQPVTSISSDGFAIRPSAIAITTTALATAGSNNSTPVIKAGAPFSVQASTSPAANYSGTVIVDASKLTTGNVRLGALNLNGAATPLSLQVNASATDNATYDEVGYFYAQPGSFRDDAFTAIDQNQPAGCDPASTCDCISSTVSNANLSDQPVGSTGRFGCAIGNTAIVSFARFIPDHFSLAATPSFSPGHAACSFTYMDQPFTLSAEIEARNTAGGKTQNYNGAFANGTVTVQMENKDNGTAIPAARLNRPGTQAWSNGSYLFAANKFTRPVSPASPDGPYDELAIGISVTDDESSLPIAQKPLLRNRDMDNATAGCTADATGTSNGTCTAVNLITTPGKTTQMRFGRLRLVNAYGSELLALPLQVKAEYFKSSAGWRTNTLDSCTMISASNVALSNHQPSGFAMSMSAANVSAPPPLANGTGRITLSKPSPMPTAKSSVVACVDLGPDTASVTAGVVAPVCSAAASANMPWLQGRWTETKYDDDPSAHATFGIYKSGPVIYLREMY